MKREERPSVGKRVRDWQKTDSVPPVPKLMSELRPSICRNPESPRRLNPPSPPTLSYLASSSFLLPQVLVLPEVSRHALIRVTDSRGREVGQGVMCLRQAFPTSVRSSSSSSFSLSEGGKEEDGGVMGAPVQALRRLVGGDREKEKKRRKGGEKR